MSTSGESLDSNECPSTTLSGTYPTFDDEKHTEIVMMAELVVRRAFGRWAISAGVPERSANVWSSRADQLSGESRDRMLAAAQREFKEVRYPENFWDNAK